MGDILKEGLIKIGFTDEQTKAFCPKLEQYIKEIILFNSAYNLTNTSDHDELVVRHLLDSLAAYKALCDLTENFADSGTALNSVTSPESDDGAKTTEIRNSSFVAADIGSGGGLPGIPLALVFPKIQFKLVERMEKRCAFLENCCALLGLKNVEVVNSEAERIPHESFDFAVFRAFRPLDSKMTKTLLRIIKKGGFLAAYKAKKTSIVEEMNGIKSIVPEYKVLPLEVPGLENSERNLVIIRKNEQ